jgi:hypothetical protein
VSFVAAAATETARSEAPRGPARGVSVPTHREGGAMSALAAQSGVTSLTLQTVAAMAVVALAVALAVVVAYSVVAGGLAWLLLLLVGLIRLLVSGAVSAWSGLRARRITRRAVPDLRVRPSG